MAVHSYHFLLPTRNDSCLGAQKACVLPDKKIAWLPKLYIESTPESSPQVEHQPLTLSAVNSDCDLTRIISHTGILSNDI